MREEIIKSLKLLEQELDVKILYAVESGSRAWGFPSKNSDWDVRFIYMHRQDWYLSIEHQKDSFEKIYPNDIDLSGWDLRKTLKLFKNSNPPLMEWLMSPIVYYEQSMLVGKLRELSTEFYVLRPILACSWIEQTNQMVPMEFDVLVESQIHDTQIKEEVYRLIKRKMSGEELDVEPKITILNQYIEDKIDYYNQYLTHYDIDRVVSVDKLDRLFRETLHEVSTHK